MKKIVFLLLGFFCFRPSFSMVRLPALLSDDMVLQQRSSAKLWGWCEPGERIYVTPSWSNKTDSARGTRDGKWQVTLATPAAGGPYTILIKGSNSITLKDILIGEVWLCSGQSNMEMCETWGLPDVRSELPHCNNPNIRFFHVPKTTSPWPQENCKGQWAACDSNELKSFSAVGYFFGKKLNAELNVPIGLIEASWGGTPAEVWTPAELVNGDTALKRGAGFLKPSDGWPYISGYCYNGMIAPLTNYTIAGALWYQGESNTAYPFDYAKLMATMIGSWRQAWTEPLPFYYVQIAPYKYGVPDQGAYVREQQANLMALENTGMVVISDLVEDTTNIHPKNKHDVGYRLAGWALGTTYHRPGGTYKNPSYLNMEAKGDKLVLNISDAPGGLMLKGGAIRELQVAGEDKVFYPGEAKIEGSHLVVSARSVKKPVAARYQFSNSGIGNVFNKEGLPLAPFRTDNW